MAQYRFRIIETHDGYYLQQWVPTPIRLDGGLGGVRDDTHGYWDNTGSSHGYMFQWQAKRALRRRIARFQKPKVILETGVDDGRL